MLLMQVLTLSLPISQSISTHDCYLGKVLRQRLNLKPEKEVSVYSKPHWNNYLWWVLLYLEFLPTHLSKKGPTHRFAKLSLWRCPNSIWHHCPFPEKAGSLHKFYQAWLPVVSGTQAINSLCVNWQAILPPFRRTCSGTPCPQDKAVRRFLHH